MGVIITAVLFSLLVGGIGPCRLSQEGKLKVLLLPYTGGADGRYKYVNSTDLRQFKLLGGVQYTLQAVHTTSKYHYNDTMNMIVASNSSSVTILKVMCTSE